MSQSPQGRRGPKPGGERLLFRGVGECQVAPCGLSEKAVKVGGPRENSQSGQLKG